MNELVLSPSLLAADFSRLADEVKRVEACDIPWLHLDVMDGHFVPNITFGPGLVKSLRAVTGLFFDVHLMIEHPAFYAKAFAEAGADLICFHVESSDDPKQVISAIKSCGCKCGMSVKPGTKAEALFPYLQDLDLILVMTVEPGFGGQSFRPECLEKVSIYRDRCKELGISPRLEVDGGVNNQTAAAAKAAGADTLVAGTYLFRAPDMKKAAELLD